MPTGLLHPNNASNAGVCCFLECSSELQPELCWRPGGAILARVMASSDAANNQAAERSRPDQRHPHYRGFIVNQILDSTSLKPLRGLSYLRA